MSKLKKLEKEFERRGLNMMANLPLMPPRDKDGKVDEDKLVKLLTKVLEQLK